MDESLPRPAGQPLRFASQAHFRATLSPGEDDEIAFETSSVEVDAQSDSSLRNPYLDPNGDQDYSQYNTQDRYSLREHNADQSCSSLKACIEEEIAYTQLDSKKRKPPIPSISVPAKKARIDEEASHRFQPSENRQLPAEIWQHIFTFLPPRMLGRLLSVNRCFNHFLDPLSGFARDARVSVATGCLSTLGPEVIWQIARRRFWPILPTPLRGHTELQMWQLACQSGCQFCGRLGRAMPFSAYDISSAGYKHTDARPVWPFALRTCGSCLANKTIKEIDLLLSSSLPSFLIPALPFVFITDDMRVIPSAMLQTGQTSMELSFTKAFLLSHVAAIQQEFASVREMGAATAAEWLKGLEGRGKEYRADSLRWEKFEMSGGLVQMRQRLSFDETQVNAKIKELPKASSSISLASAPVEKQELSELLGTSALFETTHTATPIPSLTCSRESSCARSVLEHPIRSQVNVPRRTREEAEELKAARRADIERRAMELEPPLPVHVLALIPAFQAAIQITSPLDDNAWNVLRPRLLAQRDDVDQRQLQNQKTPVRSQTPLQQLEDTQISREPTLETKQQVDKAWDDAQAPLRARISALADKIIRDDWENGSRVDKNSSPQFAVEVLMFVRRRFYAEIEKDDTATRASGRQPMCDPPNGPYTRKLTLENMKWLFDVKIKPLTESFCKELFYCHGCETNTKLYGFEGVVQHYAAKHTSSLSLGSVVVYWRAEWPEMPPFHPEPHNLKNQRFGASKHGLSGLVGSISAVFQQQASHQEGLLPVYGQSLPHSQYDVLPIQPPYGQSHPYIASPYEHVHPFHEQAPHYPINLPSNRTTYPGPPGAFHGTGLPPYQTHPALAQSFYHVQYPSVYHTKLEEIARNSREVWFSIAAVRELPGPIRAFIVTHHVFTRFQTRFSEEPSLTLFMEGLSNHKEMRPVRNINGLECKACCLGLGVTTPTDQDKESYSLPQLVKHFHQRHIERPYAVGAPALNWCTDMIHLPDLSIISNLGSLTNVDNQKLSLIYSALSAAALSDSQPYYGQGPTTPQSPDHENFNRRNYGSAVHHSHQQAFIHQPHLQHVQILEDTSQHSLQTHNPREGILNASRPSSIKPNDSDVVCKSSMPSPITTARSYNLEFPSAAKTNEDDGVDLMAGLETQLDQQASSVCRDYPLEPND
ncbi:hypothetical protein HD806DRAFT_172509 [Xylariaceae sp. AK1471]|nr:hypothetical protein HD806DRAFT_172509 [Xylariaceae sp. AK1471]